MAASVIVDAGFLVALLSSRDANHAWAAAQAARLPPPWATCEASVAEALRLDAATVRQTCRRMAADGQLTATPNGEYQPAGDTGDSSDTPTASPLSLLSPADPQADDQHEPPPIDPHQQ